MSDDVLIITTAYEQGVGHANRPELANPYTNGDGRARLAWDLGREFGKSRAFNAPVAAPVAPAEPEAERAAGVPAGMVQIGWGVRASIDPQQASALWTARPAPDDIAFMESSGGVRVVVEPVYMAAAPQPANPATGQGTLPHTEPLTWHPAAGPKLPDADATCILWIRYSDGTEDWESGWMDGDGWRLCESGGLVDGEVLFWAQPGGPRA